MKNELIGQMNFGLADWVKACEMRAVLFRLCKSPRAEA